MSERKINWDAEIISYDGEVYRKNKDANSPPATLRFLACQAIDAQLPQDQGLAKGVKRDRRYLIKRLLKPDVTLPIADIELIKERIEAIYAPWLVGACFDLLDGVADGPTEPKAA